MAQDVYVLLDGQPSDELRPDQWGVRPLLRWQRDDNNRDIVSLAWLVHANDKRIQSLLQLLGFEKAADPHNLPNRAIYGLPDNIDTTGWTLPAAVPGGPLAVAEGWQYGANPAAIGNGKAGYFERTNTTIAITTSDDGSFSALRLEMRLRVADVGGFAFPADPFTISLSYQHDRRLFFNDSPLTDNPLTGSSLQRWPAEPATPALGLANQEVYIEQTAAGSSFTHRPIPAISEAAVKFTWSKARIRYGTKNIGVHAPPEGEIGAVELKLPLVMSKVEDPTSNAVSRLLPTSRNADQGVTGPALDFSAPILAGDRSKPLIAFPVENGKTLGAAQPADFELDQPKPTGEDESKLDSLFGDLTAWVQEKTAQVQFLIAVGTAAFETAKATLSNLSLPVTLKLTTEKQTLTFLMAVPVDLWNGRLKSNRLYFYCWQESTDPVLGPYQCFDLKAFAIKLPSLSKPSQGNVACPDAEAHDGYLDLETNDLVLSFKRKENTSSADIELFFPGKFADPQQPTSDELKKRTVLQLAEFHPETWPNDKKTKEKLSLRLGARGLTLYAKVKRPSTARVKEAPAPGANPINLQLVRERKGVSSELVIINNQVRHASLFGQMAVPGFQSLDAEVELALRQEKPQSPPKVVAALSLARSDETALAKLKTTYLQMQVQRLDLALTWIQDNQGQGDWDLKAAVSGLLSLSPEVTKDGGLKDLKKPQALQVRRVDLMLFDSAPEIGFDLEQPATFDLMDGLFAVTVDDFTLGPRKEGGGLVAIQRAGFRFRSSGALDVAIEPSRLQIDFSTTGNSFGVKLKVPAGIGIDARLGEGVRFRGEVQWVDNDIERYFAAGGTLTVDGFPEVAAVLKIGTGAKLNGETVPNIVIYGQFDYEADLFAGVVMKNIGVGLGINNRLRGIGAQPDAYEILRNVDQIQPAVPSGWTFVRENGLYVSLVASTMLASNRGGDKAINAYIAQLVMALDTNLDVVAAGKLWLFSSRDFVRKADHWQRPAARGAMALRTRSKTLTFVAQTDQRPAIEGNDALADLLTGVTARFSFFLSPDLVDYYLEEISYKRRFMGADFRFFGTYRIAIGRFGMLLRAGLTINGEFPRQKFDAAVGGFEFDGKAGLDVQFGGLISGRGVALYGTVDAWVAFNATAYILVPGIAWELRRFTLSFSITWWEPHCKKWRCKMVEKSKTWTEEVSMHVPVPVMNRHDLPRQSLDVQIRGGIAIDESGNVGFRGTARLKTRIVGLKLDLEGSLTFQEHVIDRVRDRVAAVESQLNQLRGTNSSSPRALPAPRMARMAVAAGEAQTEPRAPERWLYFKRETGGSTYHLLLPHPNSTWFTPSRASLKDYARVPRDTSLDPATAGDRAPSAEERRHVSPFREMVTSIRWGDNGDAVELFMPWDRRNMDAIGEDLAVDRRVKLLLGLGEIEAALLGTAISEDEGDGQRGLEESDLKQGDLRDFEIVFDPRLESDARAYWTTRDRFELPDHALPYDFRPVEELVAEGFAGAGRTGDLDRLLLYERFRARSARVSRHAAVDRGRAEELRQARAAVLYGIVEDFQRLGGPARYGVITDLQLQYQEDDRDPSLLVTPRRRGAPAIIKAGHALKLTKELIETMTSLEFGEDAQGPWTVSVAWGDEQESVDASMWSVESPEQAASPVKHTYEKPGRYEVRFRKIDPSPLGFPAEDAEADADRRPDFVVEVLAAEAETPTWQAGLIYETASGKDHQPDLAKVQIFRDGKPVEATIERFFDDAAEQIQRRIRCLPIRQKFLPAADIERARAGDGVVQVRLPLKLHEDLLKNYLPFLNTFRIYRQFPWEPAPVLVADHVWPQLDEIEEGGKKYLLCDGFLFTDRFEVRAGAFDRERHPAGLRPDVTEVRYFLEAVPYGSGDSDEKPEPLAWPPVRLHIPARPEPLPAVALLMPVSVILGQQVATVRFIRGDGSPLPAEQQPAKVEIWAEALPLRQSGFFAGDDPDPTNAGRADAQARRPSELAVEDLLHNSEGKFKVGGAQIGGEAADPQLDMGQFQPGFSYRLYIRPATDASQPLLRRLPLFLTRALPPAGEQARALRPIEALEVIPAAERMRIVQPTAEDTWLAGRQFAWTPLAENRLRFGWDTVSALDGGVEIVIQDQDETHLVWRQLNEVMEEQVFQASERDFRNASQWRLHPKQAEAATAVAIGPAGVTEEQLPGYFLLGADGSELRDLLADAHRQVQGVLPAFEAGGLLRKAELADWFSVLFAYRRSSLYLGGPAEDLIERMVACARFLVLGLAMPVASETDELGPTVAWYEAQEEALRALLRAVAEADPRHETIRDDQAEIQRIKKLLNDYDTAERLARIVQRRLAVADELLLPQGNLEDMPGWDDGGRLPRAEEWVRLVSLFQLAPDDYPLTKQLLKIFDPVLMNQYDKRDPDAQGNVPAPVPINDYGKRTADQLTTLIQKFKKEAEDDKALAGIVTKAAGLTAALNAVEQELGVRGCTLLRRPHHRIAVADDGTGGERQAAPNPLASLLPDWARLAATESNAAQEPPEDLSGSVLFYGNLLERMGFALDIAVADDLNRLWSQQELLDLLNQIPWDEALKAAIPAGLPDYDVFLICGREPDAAGPDAAGAAGDVGYAFVKLAVVPRAFQDALAGAGYRETATIQDAVSDGTNVTLTLDRLPPGGGAAWSLKVGDQELALTVGGVITTPGNAEAAQTLKGKQGELHLANAAVLSLQVSMWLNLRSVTIAADTELQQFGRIAHYLRERTVGVDKGTGVLYVEPRGARWQTVPALGGRSHSVWTPPDLRGHRYWVGVRRVSRYEPLLRWYDRAAVPPVQAAPAEQERRQEIAVRPILSPEEMQIAVPVLVRQHPTEVQFIYQLPAVGSRALVNGISAVRSGFSGVELAFRHEPVDHSLLSAMQPDKAKPVTITGLSGGTISVDPAPGIGAGGAILTWGPAPGSARFIKNVNGSNLVMGEREKRTGVPTSGSAMLIDLAAWNLPALTINGRVGAGEGTRLILNDNGLSTALASTPDAYQNCVVLLGSEIQGGIDRRRARLIGTYDPDTRSITVTEDWTDSVEGQAVRILRLETELGVEPLPHPPAAPPRLLRHERLVALPDLPFCYRYGLGVQTLFDAAQAAVGGQSPEAGAQRRPTYLGVHKPLLTRAENGTYTLTLYLSRYGDHFSPAEAAAARRLDQTRVPLGGHAVRPWQLPDLAMGYELLGPLNPEQPAGEMIARSLVRVYLPWHERFVEPAPADYKPAECLAQVAPGDDAVKITSKKSDLLVVNDDTGPVYRVIVSFTIDGAASPPEHCRLQANRDGFVSRLYAAANFQPQEEQPI